ncbi:hypothetical protein B0A48_10116 [Cryoendolithus antarcticus]|uniref:Trafficking protein particle complex subunit 6B n=1 Tax=Cryoendolithus antarcticus TaxID=1507870 RepID=A0A1V8SX29_9PEZI|nr:hypothetical protein B0A48_10116 [Cryoendolithus antarcticus]
MSRALQSESIPPSDPLIATSCLDFLLIELVPLAQRITDKIHARDKILKEELDRSLNIHRSVPPPSTTNEVATKGGVSSTGAPSTAAGLDDGTREALYFRLNNMGYRVGQGLAERFSTNRPRPVTPLETIKFICKDLWPLLFRKQIDNLKTNHRGIFVLTDVRFQPLSRVSVDRRAGPRAAEELVRRAQVYLVFPAGVIRGALSALGIEATVQGETTEIPTATFQIKTKGAKA